MAMKECHLFPIEKCLILIFLYRKWHCDSRDENKLNNHTPLTTSYHRNELRTVIHSELCGGNQYLVT